MKNYEQNFTNFQDNKQSSPDPKTLPEYNQTRIKRMTKSADKVHKPKRTKQYKRPVARGSEVVSPDRSVTFANKVNVREYGSKSKKKRGKSAENSRVRQQVIQ